MNPEIIYLIKVNVGIALFYAFFRLFCCKDTFFQWKRFVLLASLAVSFLYPLLDLQTWIQGQEPIHLFTDLYATVILPETVIAETGHAALFPTLLYMIYQGGVLLLSLRFIFRSAGICHRVIRSSRTEIRGVQVRMLKKPEAPFSFFHWIFLHPSYPTEEIDEILIHERTHAQQYHSVDVLLSEISCIICWINPFAWLLKQEIRKNLEFLADHNVIRSGHDSKSYQYHLLELTYHKAAANLYNNFNVLPIKNRIMMMNKKRSRSVGRTKYIMFLPLAALLMLISNLEAVARISSDLSHETSLQEPKKTVQPDDQTVFELVEEMPEYPGGMDELINYLKSNIKYPEQASKEKIQGRVIAQFVVAKDGTIRDAEVVRSVSPELDAEALRVIKLMPDWKAGRHKGVPVNVKYTIPISFQLPASAEPKKE